MRDVTPDALVFGYVCVKCGGNGFSIFHRASAASNRNRKTFIFRCLQRVHFVILSLLCKEAIYNVVTKKKKSSLHHTRGRLNAHFCSQSRIVIQEHYTCLHANNHVYKTRALKKNHTECPMIMCLMF